MLKNLKNGLERLMRTLKRMRKKELKKKPICVNSSSKIQRFKSNKKRGKMKNAKLSWAKNENIFKI